MAKFTKTEEITVNCPYCDSTDVIKHGRQKGEQRYHCRDGCGKTFTDTGKLNDHRFTAEQIGAAIRLFYGGYSYKQIAEYMENAYDIPEPSKKTVYLWVKQYTDTAVKRMKDYPAVTSGEWVADESTVKVGGVQYWNWNVLDRGTRYLLASHLSKERDARAAKAVMRKALAAADKPPKNITTDKLRSYLPAIREVLPDTTHIQSEGLRAEVNNNLSERMQGTFRQRTKTLRGLDHKESGQRYLDGWVLTYNLFRDHESLDYDKPGKRAKVSAPFNEWADVVRQGATRSKRVRRPKAVAAPKVALPAKSKAPTPKVTPIPPWVFRTIPKPVRPRVQQRRPRVKVS